MNSIKFESETVDPYKVRVQLNHDDHGLKQSELQNYRMTKP